MRLLGLATLVGFSLAQNLRLQNDASYDAGLFTPLEHLHVLSPYEHTTLTHPAFPRHAVRIKKSDTFCDGTVPAYTGYIDIEARHLFFYFFESRSDPDRDDVVFWTNGGPGGSSSLGLFMELGPCRVLDAEGPKFHKESWNSNANIFFVDQPIGVGFSYAEYGETVSTTEEAARDIAAFVAIFFEHFTTFKGRAFHLSGESYGGRYLPLFASEIYDQNAYLVEQGMTPVNLSSVLIGNGLTEFTSMVLSYYDMSCLGASVPPVLSISQCVQMKQIVTRCTKWLKEACVDVFDSISCGAAMLVCQEGIDTPFSKTGLNPYDMSKQCEGVIEDTLCFPMTKHITAFLSNATIQAELGVDAHLIGKNFSVVSFDVGVAFAATQDEYRQTQLYVGALLERGVKVLAYVGTYDYICNWVGNLKWAEALEWTGSKEFVGKELKEWTVNGKRAGMTKSSGAFTFATVDGAGHMVPYDKPKESLEMLNRWLKGVDL